MKRTVIVAISILCLVSLVACKSTIKTAGSSLVTVTIGAKKAVAKIDVRPATAWAKLKLFLARTLETRDAVAAIPSNVQNIRLTVSAGGMSTITETANTAGQSDVTFVVEVPNGANRKFIVEAIDGVNNWAYWGRAFADLDGTAVTLPVNMINLGSVTGLFFVSTSGNDNTGDGTESNPFRTITNALAMTGSNQGILVEAGTYDAAAGESYPLFLYEGTALACLGPNHSTVLDDTGAAVSYVPMVSVDIGNGAPAYIDGCNIYTTQYWSTAVDDGGFVLNVNKSLVNEPMTACGAFNGINLTAANSSVTNSKIDSNPSCAGGAYNSGIVSSADVTIAGNSVTGTWQGIYVTAGNAIIQNNILTGNYDGIFISGGSASASIVGNTISGNNGNAISGNSNGILTITNNTIKGNSSGLYIYDGAATIDKNTITNSLNYGIFTGGGPSLNATITNNVLSGNSYGLYLNQSVGTINGNTITNNGNYGVYANLVGSTSIHNNKLSCNAFVDFYLWDSTASNFDLTNNAWDHDIGMLATGPTITSDNTLVIPPCPPGVDICYSALIAVPPVSLPSNTAVTGGCL